MVPQLAGGEVNVRASQRGDAGSIASSLIAGVGNAHLERVPFCHIYLERIFPAEIYAELLDNLPPKELYQPLNLRKWVRADGTSTRDQFYLTAENISALPRQSAAFWSAFVGSILEGSLKRTIFAKLAPDLADRFGVAEEDVSDIDCVYEIALVRDTEDYRIKPHPDGLNKIVTFQLYLPPDESTLDLGTSLFVRYRGLLGSRFEEVKRFPFRPNSGYAFAVSDSAKRTSWHGREQLTGFAGVRNTLMILFQQVSPRTYSA